MSATFYIYSDGADIEGIAPAMREKIESFVAPHGDRVLVVDQREKRVAHEGDLPDWEFGVNFRSDALSEEEKKDLLFFFQTLGADFGRSFVVGFVTRYGQAEDIAFVSPNDPFDLALEAFLRTAIETNQPSEPMPLKRHGLP